MRFNMGMRIGGAGSVAGSQEVGAGWKQRQQGVKDLMSALSSSDIGAAQKAYAGLAGANGATSATGPLGQIGQALQAGDLAGAQKAAQSWQAARSGHHHGHQQATTPAPTAGDTSTAASGVGSLINLTA
jgi:hypothetical protein